MNIKPTKLLGLFLLVFSLSACSWLSPYQRSLQQGNILDAASIEQLEVGMSEAQVLYLLGTPLLKAPANPGRWDYVYQLRVGDELLERQALQLNFQEQAGAWVLSSFKQQAYP